VAFFHARNCLGVPPLPQWLDCGATLRSGGHVTARVTIPDVPKSLQIPFFGCRVGPDLDGDRCQNALLVLPARVGWRGGKTKCNRSSYNSAWRPVRALNSDITNQTLVGKGLRGDHGSGRRNDRTVRLGRFVY
jgi:hypothetical protein